MARVAGASVLDWVWFVEDIAGSVTETLRKEISLVAIIVQALPAMIGVLLLAAMQRWLLRRSWRARRLTTLVFAYGLGAQFLSLFLLVFISMAASVLVPLRPITDQFGAGLSNITTGVLIVGLITAFGSSSIFMMTALRPWRAAGWRAQVGAVASVVWLLASLLGGHVVALTGAKLPDRIIQAAAGPTDPEIQSLDLALTEGRRVAEVRAAFTVRNPGTAAIDWPTTAMLLQLQLPVDAATAPCGGDWTTPDALTVVDALARPVAFLSLAPGQTTYLEVRGQLSNQSAQRPPTPPGGWALRLEFRTSAGRHAILPCVVRTPVAR